MSTLTATNVHAQCVNKHTFDKLQLKEYSTALGEWGRWSPARGDVKIEQFKSYYRVMLYDPGQSLPACILKVKYSHKTNENYKYLASYLSYDGGSSDISNKLTTYILSDVKMSDLARGCTGTIHIMYGNPADESGMCYSLKNY